MAQNNQCDFCMLLAYDEIIDEYYCTVNIDQDDLEKLRYREVMGKETGCPYFRKGDDYTIVKKQGN